MGQNPQYLLGIEGYCHLAVLRLTKAVPPISGGGGRSCGGGIVVVVGVVVVEGVVVLVVVVTVVDVVVDVEVLWYRMQPTWKPLSRDLNITT